MSAPRKDARGSAQHRDSRASRDQTGLDTIEHFCFLLLQGCPVARIYDNTLSTVPAREVLLQLLEAAVAPDALGGFQSLKRETPGCNSKIFLATNNKPIIF